MDDLKERLLARNLPAGTGCFTTFRSVMFIDPGVRGTGMAFWYNIDNCAYRSARGVERPDRVSGWTPARDLSWRDAATSVVNGFTQAAINTRPMLLVIEFPMVWTSSPKSMKATAHGDLFKLVYLIGRMEEVSRTYGCGTVVFIHPHEWKGSLTKEAVHDRILRATGTEYPAHVEDAVGMGMAVQGLFAEEG